MDSTDHGGETAPFLPTVSTLLDWAADDVRTAERAVAASAADLRSAAAFAAAADPAAYDVDDVMRAAMQHRRSLDALELATRHARTLSVLAARPALTS